MSAATAWRTADRDLLEAARRDERAREGGKRADEHEQPLALPRVEAAEKAAA